ncbi:MBOAT family O-acyltransferase [uncultured Desulfobacter sp.]|uniref:MBOAT family O-acyltransferase n=1 Tax=uncultured Desulfobacter sp. TaxID=240139 RepID=UPI002AAA6A72|nr:MBOAT family O-acyltransferase [uncultured Desulfobacter sp.]
MVFSSIEYLFIFIPAFLFAYLLLPFKNGVLLFFSILFYMWGEGYYVAVLLASIGINTIIGYAISANQKNAKVWLSTGLFLNLFLLCLFKYLGFFLNDVFGLSIDLAAWHIRLPIGISFFTFQAISYLVDIYKKPETKDTDPIRVGTYIAMFPQLIAGPIVRYDSVASALKYRQTTLDNLKTGVFLFTVGLAQKTLIANNAAIAADNIFACPPEQISMATAWLGAASYTLQIYFDFSGYSHMAIGLGVCLGFRFPENFNFPYSASSITEFWRRWHISLSTWFRDYLYIPLGGNRKGRFSTYRNLWVVFLLCGLWHGASLTFVFWGAYHGLLLVLERSFLFSFLDRIPKFLGNVYTMFLVIIGWVFFRADDFGTGGMILLKMFGFKLNDTCIYVNQFIDNRLIVVCLIGFLFTRSCIIKFLPDLILQGLVTERLENQPGLRKRSTVLLWAVSAVLFIVSVFPILAGGYNPFIYFRF